MNLDMHLDFTNKHIIITGGTGALGSAVAQRLIDAGALCSIPCFDKSELEHFELKDHDHIYIQLGVDLTNEDKTQAFYTEAIKQQGALWGSVHIAGGFGMGKIEDLTKEDFMKQINMNLVTCFNTCKTAIFHMRKEGGGRILNITSRPGLEPRLGAGMVPYAVSKAGVAALTESLAAEVVDDDILINAVAPSTIDTPANRKAMPDADFTKWPKPEDIAAHMVHLISGQNTITRGALVPVYGKS